MEFNSGFKGLNNVVNKELYELYSTSWISAYCSVHIFAVRRCLSRRENWNALPASAKITCDFTEYMQNRYVYGNFADTL